MSTAYVCDTCGATAPGTPPATWTHISAMRGPVTDTFHLCDAHDLRALLAAGAASPSDKAGDGTAR
jgi:hypothetical protein